MDLKSTPLHHRRKQARLRLVCSSMPMSRMQEKSWEDSLNLLTSQGSANKSSHTNYLISQNCGPYINLGQELTRRSHLHQSRIKNASIKISVNLVYKYKARSISELYNLCTAEEWASLIYHNPYPTREITSIIDLHIKDNLELQRKNRWEWLIGHQKFLPEEEYELLNIFRAQNIDPEYFMTCLYDLLLCKNHKRNCIRFWGIPNSCKSLIAQLIVDCFICAYANNHGSEQEFFFSNFLNKAIILCEELYVTTATIEDFKSILGGAPIDISKKFHEKQLMSRTPFIITSNFKLFGRGHLPPIDEEAILTRCYDFEFNCIYKPKITITAPAFYHLMHFLYNKDMLQ